MKYIIQQFSGDTRSFPAINEGEKAHNLEDAEKTLSQMQWIEPYGVWRAIEFDGDVPIREGRMDYDTNKAFVIWKDFDCSNPHNIEGMKKNL